MKKICLFLLIITIPLSLFALKTDELYFGVQLGVQGAINTTLGAVVAEADLTSKASFGAFLDYQNALHGDFSYTTKVFEKQYSRFTNVPEYSQFCLGFGWLYKEDIFLFALDGGLALAKIGENWEAGAYIDATPKVVLTSFDEVGRLTLGFPVQFVYTGNTYRYGFGVVASWEVYR
jgi:hypothetical protein